MGELITSPSACMRADKDNVAKVVLMPGDPLRAKFIAETYLEDPVLFNDVRNMFGYTGSYKGKKISVMGSGMGVPSMALYAQELYTVYDVEAIIRVGSAGALADGIELKDVVVAMSASTNSNFARQYDFPGTLAPTANFEMLRDAVEIGESRNARMRVGSVFTTDQFYNANGNINAMARDMEMLCVEMETAGLYLTATKLHKKALSILSISDNVFTFEGLTPEEIRESFHEMMIIALETAWKATE